MGWRIIIQRLTSLLGRRAGEISAKLIAVLKKRGVVVDSMKDLIARIRGNPGIATVVLASLVEIGVDVTSLFDGVDDTDDVTAGMKRVGMKRINEVSDKDAELVYDGSLVQLTELKDLVAWSRVMFGTANDERLITAHGRLRQLVETSTEDFAKGVALFGRTSL